MVGAITHSGLRNLHDADSGAQKRRTCGIFQSARLMLHHPEEAP